MSHNYVQPILITLLAVFYLVSPIFCSCYLSIVGFSHYQVKSVLLSKLFTASNLTQEAGDTVLSEFGQMAALLPSLQEKLGNVSNVLANEPLLLKMRKSFSFGDILSCKYGNFSFLKVSLSFFCIGLPTSCASVSLGKT